MQIFSEKIQANDKWKNKYEGSLTLLPKFNELNLQTADIYRPIFTYDRMFFLHFLHSPNGTQPNHMFGSKRYWKMVTEHSGFPPLKHGSKNSLFLVILRQLHKRKNLRNKAC